MKRLLFLSLLLLPVLMVCAQQTDSVTFVKAKWEKRRLARGVKLFTHHFADKNLFKANQYISFVEMKNNGRKVIAEIAADKKALLEVAAFATDHDALAAVNGNFFDVKNGGSVDYIKIKGNVISHNLLNKEHTRAAHQKAAVLIDKGILRIAKWDGTDTWEDRLPAEDIMLNGPLLRLNKSNEVLDSSAFNRLRHPRTCVGIKENGHLILLTIDGRNENADGMALPELQKIMQWLGCSDALNFDGGGSTTLWVQNDGLNGVVNHPSDNKKWDHEGSRKVANVILIKKK